MLSWAGPVRGWNICSEKTEATLEVGCSVVEGKKMESVSAQAKGRMAIEEDSGEYIGRSQDSLSRCLCSQQTASFDSFLTVDSADIALQVSIVNVGLLSLELEVDWCLLRWIDFELGGAAVHS